MSPEDDALDGFRAQDLPDLSDDEAALLRALEENRGVLEVINVGVDMQRFKASKAGETVWKNAETKLAESIQVWLSTDDCTTPKVRNAHFNARVAIEVLKTFQEAIDAGREMTVQMRQNDDEQAGER